MSSSVSNALSSLTSANATTSTNSATDPLASESTFLTLLVSQLQNQDPLDPVDSNQFVSQLTSYSQLEQLIGIHSDTTSLSNAATASQNAATSATTPAAQTAQLVTPAATTSPAAPTTPLAAAEAAANAAIPSTVGMIAGQIQSLL